MSVDKKQKVIKQIYDTYWNFIKRNKNNFFKKHHITAKLGKRLTWKHECLYGYDCKKIITVSFNCGPYTKFEENSISPCFMIVNINCQKNYSDYCFDFRFALKINDVDKMLLVFEILKKFYFPACPKTKLINNFVFDNSCLISHEYSDEILHWGIIDEVARRITLGEKVL